MADAQKFWDRLATRWDKGDEEPERTDTTVTARIRPYLKATDIVLDYGCATGGVCFRLADAVEEIHGIDISPNMITAAKRRAAAGDFGNVSFAQATIFDEGLEAESFDVILACAIFHLLEDGPQVMRRTTVLLKPGGLLLSVTPCLRGGRTLAKAAVMPFVRLASGTGLIPHVERYRVGELLDSMEAAGLVVIETEELAHSASEYFVAARKS